ncbi:MAG TPA: AgmX/PglI C-terminal domain-containing protein [Kofleriaceae bacterium]|nr:AgmX/PglI C-terminal domain-containing protein [Kofleriaceae bacterium]
MSLARCLRVGILLGDRLVEERLFEGSAPVTLGQSWKCALSLPIDGMPREHVLFAREGERYVLRPFAGMTGKLAHGDAITAIEGARELVLERGVRGRLHVGDATILFQDVARPPAAPRPQLPASVRGTFADRVDWRLAAILGGSLLVHVAIAAWAWHEDVELAPYGEPTAQTTYSQDVIDVIDDTPLRPPPAPATTEPATAAPAPRPAPHPHPTTPAPVPTTTDAARLAAILASDDVGATGPAGMSHRQPGADLDQQIQDVRGHRVTIGDGAHTSRADDRARLGTGTDRLAIDDPTALDHLADRGPETAPHGGRVTLGPIKTEDPRTTLTAELVVSKIGGLYMSGLQRCYRKGLAGDAQLSGKLALVFTVDERGGVTDASATGVDSQVAACVTGLMAGWHFPEPRAKDGESTDVTFHVSLSLQPS